MYLLKIGHQVAKSKGTEVSLILNPGSFSLATFRMALDKLILLSFAINYRV